MENSRYDAERAMEMMKKNMKGDFIDDFSIYSACYVFSNENMSDYYPKFNMMDGKVLTVCGSGDQVLMSVLSGARKVDCFDSNRLAYYNLMLKIGAISNLDYSDFCSLYNLPNRVCNRKEIYKKFNDKLDPSIKYFWDYIFINGEFFLGVREFFPYFFKERDEEFYKAMSRISYLSEENFNKLKVLLSKCEIEFKNCNFLDIFNNFSDLYNFINFSNISTYVDKINFIKVVRDSISNHLVPSGNIMINYSWYAAHSISSVDDIGKELLAPQVNISPVLYQGKESPSSIMFYSKKR